MSSHKAEKFYNSLVQLQSELEKTVVKKCQQLIEEIMKSEKQVLLQNIHKLVENELADLLDPSHNNINSQSQKFRCDSCNKHFPSTNIGQITITPTDNGMTYESSEYYNETECRDPFLESGNYEEQDHSSSEMPDIKPIVEILQYDPLNSNNIGESSSSLSITSNGVNDDELPVSNYPRNKDGNFEIINTMTTVETPTSSSAALHNRKIIPHSQFYPARNKMRPFKNYIDKRSVTSVAPSDDRIKRIFALSKRNPYVKPSVSARGVVPSPADANSVGGGARASYACPLCSYVFNNAGKLERHLRSHTGEKPFACSYCSKRFGGKSNLLSHMRNHTGETPYECSQCQKKFKFSYSLTHHMKRYH